MAWILAHLDTIIILAALIAVERRITQNQIILARFLEEKWYKEWRLIHAGELLVKSLEVENAYWKKKKLEDE